MSLDDGAAAIIKRVFARAEQNDVARKELAEDDKLNWGEAKDAGLDVKILKKVYAKSRIDPDKLAEEMTIMELYEQAAGVA